MRRYDIVLADPDQPVRVSNLCRTFRSLTHLRSLRRARASSENPFNVMLVSSDEIFDASFQLSLIPLLDLYLLISLRFFMHFSPYIQVIVIQHCKSYHLTTHEEFPTIDVGIFTHF